MHSKFPAPVRHARSANSRILSATGLVGMLTLVVSAIVFGKDLLVARYFGRSAEIDAFLLAYMLPTFIATALGGSLASAFLPVYVELQEREGAAAASQLLWSTALSAAAILGVACCALWLALPVLLDVIAAGFAPAKKALTIQLCAWLLPGAVLSGVAGVCASALNAARRFALAALCPIAPPAMMIVGLLLGDDTSRVHALAGGTIAGIVLQCAILVAVLWHESGRLRPARPGMTPALRRVGRQYAPLALSSLLMATTAVVDQSMAASLGEGGVATLSYATKIPFFIAGLGALAVGTAVYPHFATMVATGDWRSIRATLKFYVPLVFLAASLTAGVGVFLSDELVALAFQRGAFAPEDVEHVGSVQRLLLIHVPFYILAVLFVRLISSMQRNSLLLWGSAINLAVDIALNVMLVREFGVAGIGIAIALVHVVSCSFLGIVLWHIVRWK